jgi:hypothetical protein
MRVAEHAYDKSYVRMFLTFQVRGLTDLTGTPHQAEITRDFM